MCKQFSARLEDTRSVVLLRVCYKCIGCHMAQKWQASLPCGLRVHFYCRNEASHHGKFVCGKVYLGGNGLRVAPMKSICCVDMNVDFSTLRQRPKKRSSHRALLHLEK